MSYVDRMNWRMMGPALIPIVLGGAAAGLLSTLLDLPFLRGGQALLPDLPLQAVMIGAGISLAMLVYQTLGYGIGHVAEGLDASCAAVFWAE